MPYTSGLAGAAGHTGSRLFDGVPLTGLVPAGVRQTPHVTHLTYRRA